ncbi:MAG: YqhA family protein [Bacteroidota bacterium]
MKLLEYLFRGTGIVASIGLFFLGIAVGAYALISSVELIQDIVFLSATKEKLIYQTMEIMDLILLGFSIFIASIGIYELFVQPLKNFPAWIQVLDLDTLKGMLIKVVIVVMGISFMGKVVTWDGEQDLMNFGIAVSAVIFALSYFLNVKIKVQKKE